MDINKARALFFEDAYEQCDHLEHALLDRETYPANPFSGLRDHAAPRAFAAPSILSLTPALFAC